MTDTPHTGQLRDRIADAIRSAPTGRFNVATITDAVLAVVQPDLDRARAEQRSGCPDPIECDHEAAAGQALAELEQARATVRRLNYRAQQAESTVTTIARAVRDWQFTERGTYMPLRSLGSIARVIGQPVPDGRFELHYQRVEHLQAELDRTRAELAAARAAGMREAAAMLCKFCPTHGAEDTCLMDCHCAGADAINRDARAVSTPTDDCGCKTNVHPGHYPSCPTRDAAPTTQSAACPCRAPGQDGDGRVRYQARDGEFVNLPCRSHVDVPTA